MAPEANFFRVPSDYKFLETIYDETHLARPSAGFHIGTVGNRPNLMADLDHYSPGTDSFFTICVAGGAGVLVNKEVWESIPEEHRPVLDASYAGHVVPNRIFTNAAVTALGSVIFPVILTQMSTYRRFRIKVFALVVPNLPVGMLIGYDVPFYGGEETTRGRSGMERVFTFRFNGNVVKVQGR